MFVDDPEGRVIAEARSRPMGMLNNDVRYNRPSYTFPVPLTSPDAPVPQYANGSGYSIWDSSRYAGGKYLPNQNTFNLNGRTGKFWGGQIVYDDPKYVPFSQRPLQTTSVAPARELPQGISAGRASVVQPQGNPNAEMMIIMPDGSRVPKSVYTAQLAQQRAVPVPVQRANANRDVNNVYSEAYAAQNRPAELSPWEYYQKYVLR